MAAAEMAGIKYFLKRLRKHEEAAGVARKIKVISVGARWMMHLLFCVIWTVLQRAVKGLFFDR